MCDNNGGHQDQQKKSRRPSNARRRRLRAHVEAVEQRLLLSVSLVSDHLFGTQGSTFGSAVNLNGTAYFVANTPSQGLWKSDGTAAGTTLLKDFGSDPSAGPEQLADAGGAVYFSAPAGADGRELWKSDGTVQGTAMLKDIAVGPNSSNPSDFTDVNSTVFFAADDGDQYGRELWKTDGTAVGTVMVKDINPGTAPSNPEDLINVNGTLYFTADDGDHGRELWKSDGTAAGTVMVKDIRAGGLGAQISGLTNFNGTLFFAASDGYSGIELWKSDGTNDGTTLVKDIEPGPGSSSPANFTAVGNTLYFTAFNYASGTELWKTDGTSSGTAMVQDINPGPASSSPSELVTANGKLFFLANDGSGVSLWTTDGTAAGTVKLPANSPTSLATTGQTLFFTATDSATGTELWTRDGTSAGTHIVRDINHGQSSSNPTPLATIGGALFFAADDGFHGTELWKSDGTSAGTQFISDLNTTPVTGVSPTDIFAGADRLFYTGSQGGLFATDGSPDGGQRLTDVALSPSSPVTIGMTTYFAASANGSASLWKSDGTPDGTTVVATFNDLPTGLVAFGGRVYFAATAPGGGILQLWKSDGTATGTVPVQPSGAPISAPLLLTSAGGTLFFYGNGPTGSGLFKTDGAGTGTALVTTLGAPPVAMAGLGSALLFVDSTGALWGANATASSPTLLVDPAAPGHLTVQKAAANSLAVLNGFAYFVVTDSAAVTSLWRTDGTVTGTQRVRVFAQSFSFGGIFPVGGVLLIINSSGLSGTSLWRSDGTAAGTVNIGGSFAGGTVSIGSIFAGGEAGYFIGSNPASGIGGELWTTDGTAAGTVPVADINLGAGGSNPQDMSDLQGTVYFIADDGTHGPQLWKVQPTTPPAAVTSLTAIASSPSQVNLSWTWAGSDVSGFRVERSAASDFSDAGDVFTLPPAARTLNDAAVSPGTTFYYRVTAFNSAGTSAPATVSCQLPFATLPASLQEVAPSLDYSRVQVLTSFNGKLYFNAYGNDGGFCQTDGTTISTVSPSFALGAAVAGNTLFFVTRDTSLFYLWKTRGSGAATTLVKTFPWPWGLGYGYLTVPLVAFGGSVYFPANDGVHGVELWKSDGTPEGTMMLKDIYPGSTSSDPDGFTVTGNTLFFFANDGVHGYELWKTDGSTVGTVLVRDLNPGPNNSVDQYAGQFAGLMANVDGTLFFRADVPGTRPGSGQIALWKSDGTDAGTIVLGQFYPTDMVGVGNLLYFSSSLNGSSSVGLWTSDGTVAGTRLVKVIPPPFAGSGYDLHHMTAVNGKLFFDDGDRLWVSDGTAAGTVILGSFGLSGNAGPIISDLVAVAGKVFFDTHAGDGKVWTSDGTLAGTMQVPGLVPTQNVNEPSPSQLTDVDGTLFLAADATSPPAPPTEGKLWTLALSVPPPPQPGQLTAIAVSGNEVDLSWMESSEIPASFLLQRSTSATFDVINKTASIAAGATTYADTSVVGGQTYYYRLRAYDRGGVSDFVMAGPIAVRAAPAPPSGLAAAAINSGSVELYWTDNATNEQGFVLDRSQHPDFSVIETTVTLPTGTTHYVDTGLARLTTYYYRLRAFNTAGSSGAATTRAITPESLPLSPANLLAVGTSNSEIDLQWTDLAVNETGYHLERATADTTFAAIAQLPKGSNYYSDTSAAPGVPYRYRVVAVNSVGEAASEPTAFVTSSPPSLSTEVAPNVVSAGAMVQLNGSLYFSGPSGLWKTDGTAAGTVKIDSHVPQQLTLAGDRLYYEANDPATGNELWTSDGTPAGTHLVKDVFPGNQFVNDLVVLGTVGSSVFYAEQQNQSDYQLWKTNDTGSDASRVGTVLVDRGLGNGNYAVSNGILYFPVRSPTFIGTILWRSDGTASGTYRVPGINSNQQGGDLANQLTDFNGTLLFVARDPNNNIGEWEIAADGTAVKVNGPPLDGATVINGKLYSFGNGLSITDSNLSTTSIPAAPPGPTTYSFHPIVNANGILYFLGYVSDPTAPNSLWLWRSDGTAAGTFPLHPFAYSDYHSPDYLVPAGNLLFFSDGIDLWRTDGTVQGTYQVVQISDSSNAGYHPNALLLPAPAGALGDKFIFSVFSSTAGGMYVATLTPPAAPTALTVTVAGGTPQLAWSNNSTNETGFVIERSSTADFSTIDLVLHAPAGSASFVDISAGQGPNWYYRVRAVNAGGYSGYSNIASTSTAPATAVVSNTGASESLPPTGQLLVLLGTRLVGAAAPLSAVEGKAFANSTVATFSSPDGPVDSSGDSAVIDWGDGFQSPGIITPRPDGSFAVMGNHTYTEDGGYPVDISIRDQHGIIASTVTNVTVVDALLSMTARPLATTVMAPTTAVLANFTDASPYGTLSDFTATIDWGDGHTTPGVVRPDGSGNFTVTGTNTYASAGSYTARITIKDAGGSTNTAQVPVTVAPIQHGGGSISGVVFNDLNTDGIREIGEPPIFDATVFLDLNGNGVLDPGEPYALIAADGSYTLPDVPEGHYMLKLAPLSGFQTTTPIDGSEVPVSIVSGQVLSGMDLGAARLTTNVVGRFVFYNNSALEGNNPVPNASDDAAIASDKQALRPGHTATFANYTSYAKGINGIMVDISNLPSIPTAADFSFAVGADNNPSAWQAARPPSSVTVRSLPGHASRITIIWPDNAIQDQWLQVMVKADANTGLSSPDVFYFGNLIGDANGDGKVGFPDLVLLARNFGQKVAVGDFDADGKVDFSDLVILARQFGQSLPLISVPPFAAVQQAMEVASAFANQEPVAIQSLFATPNFGPGDPTSDERVLHRVSRARVWAS